MCPTLGKVRIVQMLARAGLHIGSTTVGRMLKREPCADEVVAKAPVVVGTTTDGTCQKETKPVATVATDPPKTFPNSAVGPLPCASGL